MNKSQMNIAAMLKKAGRKVTVIDSSKTMSPAQIADEQEREKQMQHTCRACGCVIDRYGSCGCNPHDA